MKTNKKSNKKFTVSGALFLILMLFVMFSTTGCQKQPWANRTVWNVGIVGDYDNAVNSCRGTVSEGNNGQFYCMTETKYNVGIFGDYDRAVNECDGTVIEGINGYYDCWVESPKP